jgi:superfamily II DNA/RNA helicase
LAVQVLDVLKKLLGNSVGSTLIIGGESMPAQIQKLRSRPRLIVGTPGRINDHLERGTLMLHDVGFLVLDETDRMLDMGFAIQLERIFKFLPATRQTLMFSATLPDNILQLSSKFMRSPERVAVGHTNKAHEAVTQEILHTTADKKYDLLLEQLDKRTGSVIIFVKTKHGADRLAEKLSKQKHSADAIHGDLRQRQRERVIMAFRDKKYRIMVATDIAARGLDIPHIEHVINYDLPQCPEDYIHRIGRTARNGAEGSSICLLAPEDSDKWRAIHRLMHPGEAPPPRHPSAGAKKPYNNYNGNNGKPGGKKPFRFGNNRPRRSPVARVA